MKRLVRSAASLFVVAAILLVPAASIAATKKVTARPSSWGPARLEITKGSTVVWTNPSTFEDHSVKSYGGWRYRELLGPKAQATRRFREVGRFKYRCEFPSTLMDGVCDGMCGVVKVVRAGWPTGALLPAAA